MPQQEPRSQQIGEVLATGLSLPTRSVLLCDSIEDSAVRLVWTALQALDEEGETIDITLCSGGGDMTAGWAIYDMLRAAKSWIRITGAGKIYSMATVILQAGDERLLHKSASVMIHPVQVSMSETAIPVLQCELEDAQAHSQKLSTLLSSAIGISPKQFQTRFCYNHYFSAQKAVELGLADSVVG